MAYLRPTQVAATLPPVVTAASGTEWRRQGFHLIPQVPLRVQACRCSVSLFLPLKLVCQSEQVLARCISHNQLFLGWSFLVPLHLNINSAHPPPPPPPPSPPLAFTSDDRHCAHDFAPCCLNGYQQQSSVLQACPDGLHASCAMLANKLGWQLWSQAYCGTDDSLTHQDESL